MPSAPPTLGCGLPEAVRGRVTLIVGCMFSGKTTELLRQVHRAAVGTAAVFKHSVDARYSPNAIVSHRRASHPAWAVSDPGDILARVGPNHHIAAVDEAHFFAVELVEIVKQLRDRNMQVLLTALDRDSWGRVFPVVERLRAIAHLVREMTTFCARCGGLAERTQRLTPILDRSMVGGPESYEPRCLQCWKPPPEFPID